MADLDLDADAPRRARGHERGGRDVRALRRLADDPRRRRRRRTTPATSRRPSPAASTAAATAGSPPPRTRPTCATRCAEPRPGATHEPRHRRPRPHVLAARTDGTEHAPGGAPATVVVFTCNHCPYALAWHDRIAAVARDYADRGVAVLAVNPNDAERYPRDSFDAMRARVERDGGWPMPYLRDESQEVARAYDARTTPDVLRPRRRRAPRLPRRARRRPRRSRRWTPRGCAERSTPCSRARAPSRPRRDRWAARSSGGNGDRPGHGARRARGDGRRSAAAARSGRRKPRPVVGSSPAEREQRHALSVPRGPPGAPASPRPSASADRPGARRPRGPPRGGRRHGSRSRPASAAAREAPARAAARRAPGG